MKFGFKDVFGVGEKVVDSSDLAGRQKTLKKSSEKQTQPKKASKEEIFWAILRSLGLVLLTGGVLFAMSWFLPLAFMHIIGPEKMDETIWSAVYSTLMYVITFGILVYATNLKKFSSVGVGIGVAMMVIQAAGKPIALKLKEGDYVMPAGVELAISAIWTLIFAVLLVVSFMLEKRKKEKEKEKENEKEKEKSQEKAVKRRSMRELLGLKGLPTWTDIGLGVVGLVAALILATALTSFFSLFSWFDSSQKQDVGFSETLFGPELAIAFVILAVVAPIAEELIFRGWLYGKVRSVLGSKLGKWGSMLLAIFLVSMLFAVMHGQMNVGVTVFAMSVVMCALREITGTIYAGILVHILKNALAFVYLYVLMPNMMGVLAGF